MTAARKSLLAKIKALLAKTVENGCTEAEALAALAKASAMMAEHDVTAADLDLGDEEVKARARTVNDRDRIRENLCSGVAVFTDCKTWFGVWRDEINFAGLDGDVMFAEWLLDTLAEYVGRELASFLARTYRPGMPRIRRRETEAFVEGCCARISRRLHELAAGRQARGTGLVLHKSALIERMMAEKGINLSRSRGRFRLLDGAAHHAGEMSGDRATFDRPIEEQPEPLGVAWRGQGASRP
jgi:hypothetical protein